MRELVLIQPGRLLAGTSEREDESSRLHREFEERLAECGPLAFRVAYGVLRHAPDAEDVAQEALLKAYRNFGRLREPASFRGWLVRIAFRMALDRWRSVKRREKREAPGEQMDPGAAGPTVEELAVSSEFQVRLERAMEELPEKFRLVVLLAGIQGYTLEEVSGMLGIPMGTVKSRLFRANSRCVWSGRWRSCRKSFDWWCCWRGFRGTRWKRFRGCWEFRWAR